jgi:hypothetical protein
MMARPSLAPWGRAAISTLLISWTIGGPPLACAIDVHPSPERIQAALARGKAAASARIPPTELYVWFGGASDLEPRGFLLTKLAGLSVLATHFALRSAEPTEADIRQVLDQKTMLVSVTLYGYRPTFAQGSYMVLIQGDRTIKPLTVRSDGQASLSPAWPKTPPFQAKVVASFLYEEFDPLARTRIVVFPASGGEVSFDLDFATVD